MKMTAKEAMEKLKQNPEWSMTPEDAKEIGKEGLRRLLYSLLDMPEYRKAMVDWYMKMYEPYFKES